MQTLFGSFRAIGTIIVLVLAFVLYPATRSAENFNNQSLEAASIATREFVDTVRSKGYVDNRDFTLLQQKLSAAGREYTVEMEYSKKVYQPNYGDPNDFYTFKDSYDTLFEGYYTKDILDKVFPKNSTLAKDDPARRYNMHVGDMFQVTIESTGTDVAALLRSIISPTSQSVQIYSYGGMIRNEAP